MANGDLIDFLGLGSRKKKFTKEEIDEANDKLGLFNMFETNRAKRVSPEVDVNQSFLDKLLTRPALSRTDESGKQQTTSTFPFLRGETLFDNLSFSNTKDLESAKNKAVREGIIR